MNPNDAERIHQHRRELAELAEAHGFIAKKPHAGEGWIWLELYHPDRYLRIAIEWSDDLPTGCQLHATCKGYNLGVVNVRSVRTLTVAITEPAFVDALRRPGVQ